MRIIYKYPIPIQDGISVEMPQGAEILTVQIQRGVPCIWAMVDPDSAIESRHFRLAGTGHRIAEEPVLRYVGSFQMHEETLIYHLFEYDKN